VDTVKPLPSLANELLLYIFKLSSYEDSSTSAVLVRLCKATQKWVTPLLYKLVLLETESQVLAFSRTVKTTNLGSRVRTLIIRLDDPYHIITRIAAAIRGCPQLETLYDSGIMSHEGMNRRRPRFPAPWQMDLLIDSGLSGLLPPVGHPLLRCVTHLHIFGFRLPEFDDVAVTLILSITTLTHLACSALGLWPSASSCIQRILSSAPSLSVLLLLNTPPDELPTWEELIPIEDERFLARPGIGWYILDEYEDIMISGRSLWDDADKYKNWRNLVFEDDEALEYY
jgi:hypothetical protein